MHRVLGLGFEYVTSGPPPMHLSGHYSDPSDALEMVLDAAVSRAAAGWSASTKAAEPLDEWLVSVDGKAQEAANSRKSLHRNPLAVPARHERVLELQHYHR